MQDHIVGNIFKKNTTFLLYFGNGKIEVIMSETLYCAILVKA